MNRYVLVWVGGAVLLALGILPALLGHPHTDESWPLYLAQRVLEGQRHGVDFFEINPPLYIWLCMPAAWIHRLIGITHWQAWVLLVGCAAVLSLLLVARQLQRSEEPSGRKLVLLLAAGFVLLVLPRSFFSEREHLSLLLTLPFLFTAAQRAAGGPVARGDAVLAGLLGAVGFSIKPHFLIPWLLLELWLAVTIGRRSLRRLELWTLVAFGAGYLLATLLLTPDYFPMARKLASLYHAYLNNGLAGSLRLAGPGLLVLVVIAVALRVAIPARDRLLDAFSVAFAGFFTAAVVQQKGFPYHYLPAWGVGLLMIARAWQLRPADLSWRPSGILVRAGAMLLAGTILTKMGASVRELVRPDHERSLVIPEYPSLVQVTSELARGEPIIVLSTSPDGGWPLTLEAKARWASRYMHFWPLAAIYDRELWSIPPRIIAPVPLEQRSEIERRFFDEIIEDLTHHRPRLMFIPTPDITQWGSGGSQRFDYLAYFGRDPRFRDFLAGYRLLRQIGTYQVWMRISA